jgi:hypothetical protein
MVRQIRSRPGRSAVALLTLAVAALLALDTVDSLQAQALGDKTSAGKVKAQATATKPDASGKQVITVTLDIDKGWHLYANPPDNKIVADAQTVVTVKTPVKPQSVDVKYPPGSRYFDEVAKETFKVYEGRVMIRAIVQRAAGDTGPLQVLVKVNACNRNTCLKEATITVPVQ